MSSPAQRNSPWTVILKTPLQPPDNASFSFGRECVCVYGWVSHQVLPQCEISRVWQTALAVISVNTVSCSWICDVLDSKQSDKISLIEDQCRSTDGCVALGSFWMDRLTERRYNNIMSCFRSKICTRLLIKERGKAFWLSISKRQLIT